MGVQSNIHMAIAHAEVKPNPYSWGVQKPPDDKEPHAGLWLSISQIVWYPGSPHTCKDRGLFTALEVLGVIFMVDTATALFV